eukprot:TRINITY_DN56795_c0_g1_i1.p1 TRINITY_DN56795_c0_g1~~TRINITY_DN56795_c0_g1_i1.p1  ORF type:complete len:380 (-),score=51.79 TRINITY_DN56795_c0_g1_i1:47-1186(-)
MAAGARVQLPAETSSSSFAGNSHTRTLSHEEHEDVAMTSTLLPQSMSATQLNPMAFEADMEEQDDLRSIVARMEALQSQQRSMHQPSDELDAMIARQLVGHPEQRHRMAVMTKSALLRQKILTQIPQGGRSLGCAVLGSTYSWRQHALPDDFSDHNWPKGVHNQHGIHHLPGGDAHHDRVLRCPIDKRTYHPTLSSTEFYSIPRTKRFPGTLHNGEIDKVKVQLTGTPGPGAYFKSVPRGTQFSVDGGETVVLGANHTYPWKKCLGRQINPVDVDAVSQVSAPSYSFPRMRRTLSDPCSGHGLQDGGPVKTDHGGLSPGPVYELHSTMRPMYGSRTLDGSQSCVRRKYRNRLNSNGRPAPRVRCVPVPPEAPKDTEESH